MAYYVYILENPDGRLYVGQTQDLDRRVEEHNTPTHNIHKHTTKHPGLWNLVHFETYQTRQDAIARERQIKAMKSTKWIMENLLAR